MRKPPVGCRYQRHEHGSGHRNSVSEVHSGSRVRRLLCFDKSPLLHLEVAQPCFDGALVDCQYVFNLTARCTLGGTVELFQASPALAEISNDPFQASDSCLDLVTGTTRGWHSVIDSNPNPTFPASAGATHEREKGAVEVFSLVSV